MSWLTDIFKPESITLDLKRASAPSSSVLRPMIPQLDTSYDSMLKYSRKNQIVFACIEKKANAATDAELVVEKRTSDGEWEKETGHPLVTLLNKPNPYDDGESFIRSWVASENFADYFFCEIVFNGAKQPVGLYPLHPAYITPQYESRQGRGNVLAYYSYYVDGYEVRFQPEELMIRRRHGVGSIYTNVSPMSVALSSVDADTSWTEYIRAFFNNGGTPSGVLNFTGRKLSATEVKAYQQQWVQKYGRHGTNRAGVAVIDGAEVNYQVIGSGLDELESGELTEIQETRICMPFGVPPVIIGAYVGLKNVNQKASFQGAMTEFWENTMSPELKSIRNYLTWNMLPYWEDIEKIRRGDIRVNWNLAQVKALQEDVDLIHTRIQEDFKAQLITRDEARAVIKFPPCEDEEVGKEFFRVAVKEEPDEDVDEEEDDEDEKKTILDAHTLEKKTFEYEGLTLGREPTELEKSINLKGMVDDFESGKVQMAKVVLALRSELIVQSVSALRSLDAASIGTLTLTPLPKAYARVHKVVESLFIVGRNQVIADLSQQKFAKTRSAILGGYKRDVEEAWKAFLGRISDLVISRIISEVSTRAINFFVSRGLLDRDDNEIIAQLREALEDQSTKMYEDIAQQAANSAIGAGRDAEIEARDNEWEIVEYSAILDANTCDVCEDADGMQGATSSEIPDAPNPECAGQSRCRCFHICILKEEKP